MTAITAKTAAQESIISGEKCSCSIRDLFQVEYDDGTIAIVNKMLDNGYSPTTMLVTVCMSRTNESLRIPLALCLRKGANPNTLISSTKGAIPCILYLSQNTSNSELFQAYYYIMVMFGLNLDTQVGDKTLSQVLSLSNRFYVPLSKLRSTNPAYVTRLALICDKMNYVVSGSLEIDEVMRIQISSFINPSKIQTVTMGWLDLGVYYAISRYNSSIVVSKKVSAPYPVVNMLINAISKTDNKDRWLVRELIIMLQVLTTNSELDGYQHKMLNKTVAKSSIGNGLSSVVGQDMLYLLTGLPQQFLPSLKRLANYLPTPTCKDGSYPAVDSKGDIVCVKPYKAREALSKGRITDKRLNSTLRSVRALETDYKTNDKVVAYESEDNAVILDESYSKERLDEVLVKTLNISCLKNLEEEHARVTFAWIASHESKNNYPRYVQMMDMLRGGTVENKTRSSTRDESESDESESE